MLKSSIYSRNQQMLKVLFTKFHVTRTSVSHLTDICMQVRVTILLLSDLYVSTYINKKYMKIKYISIKLTRSN